MSRELRVEWPKKDAIRVASVYRGRRLVFQYPVAKGKKSISREAQAEVLLIVAAVNTFKRINPDNPLAVAENIELLLEKLSQFASCYPERDNEQALMIFRSICDLKAHISGSFPMSPEALKALKGE